MSPSIKQMNMREYKRLHGTSVIPYGDYCYRHSGIVERIPGCFPRFKVDVCPYWDIDEDQHEQSNGYCWYIEKGDWEEDGTFLLFDQCKECGIKNDCREYE